MSLTTALGTANDDTMRFTVVLKAITGPLVIMHGKFARWCDDQYSSALFWRKMSLAQELHSGYHIGKRLSTTGLRSSQDIAPVEHVRNRACLNLCSFCEAKLSHGFLGLLRKGQIAKL